MRISDWSSDVCSSDLEHRSRYAPPVGHRRREHADTLAAVFEPRPRRVERADLPFDLPGLLREIEPRLGLVDLGGEGDAVFRSRSCRIGVETAQDVETSPRARTIVDRGKEGTVRVT